MSEHQELAEQIARLIGEQPYAVLCTQGQGQPYGSLVALAVTADLRLAVFATPVDTRKYRLLRECGNVALVVDSRSRATADLMAIEAFTATGRAEQVPAGPEFERLAGLLLSRHPALEAFVRSPTTALFRVEIAFYFHVSRFQEVRQWAPADG